MINYIDILIVIIFISSIYNGWYRGFIFGLLDLIRWVGSLLLALRFYPYLANWLNGKTDWSEAWTLPVSFFVVAIVASILLQTAGLWVLRKLPPDIHIRKANHALGLIPGFINAFITVAILSVLLLALPLPESIEKEVHESKLADKFGSYTERLENAMTPIFDKAVGRTLNNLTIHPESNKTIALPYKVAKSKPRPDLEAEMLEMINKERAAEGLKPLKMDTALTRVARLHSADMFRRGYFSHYTPEGKDAFYRIRKGNVKFITAGENLALAPSLTIAHEGLMDSPGHRANILRKGFGRVGIGVMAAGPHRLMMTQNFRN
ncbi:CvpA family protein [Adhaeribacter aquaticus]|uniref:CvpA family protein n=1 Tax=Adhaeribacter aquaticus TaxID=299567 RepID=UPI00040E590E|nr:CvpA family protein [Adhaeribacter aquaticus]